MNEASGRKNGGLPAVDLFAGAGGLSLGATWAGADVRLAVDTDVIACETLRRNESFLDGAVCEKDVKELGGADLRQMAGLTRREPMLVVGGPPCQGFSKAAFWTEEGEDARYRRARARGEEAIRPPTPEAPPREDPRRPLIREFWRLVTEAQAEAFLFENVPSILAPRHRAMLNTLIKAFEDLGYGTTLVKANAVEFGVAQRRQRVFLLGVRGGLAVAPEPTHYFGDQSHVGRNPAVSAGEVLTKYRDGRFFEPEEVVEGKWARHLAEVPPGWNYKFHTEWGGHPRPTFVTETRFWNFLLKLSPELPSWTIPANPGPWVGPFHWESRRLRTPELAALQAFPDGYVFAGNRRDRVRQVGNAVPPLLAQRMVERLLQAMGEEMTSV